MSPRLMTWKKVSNKITDLSLPILKILKPHENLGASGNCIFQRSFGGASVKIRSPDASFPKGKVERKPPENRADEILRPPPARPPAALGRRCIDDHDVAEVVGPEEVLPACVTLPESAHRGLLPLRTHPPRPSPPPSFAAAVFRVQRVEAVVLHLLLLLLFPPRGERCDAASAAAAASCAVDDGPSPSSPREGGGGEKGP